MHNHAVSFSYIVSRKRKFQRLRNLREIISSDKITYGDRNILKNNARHLVLHSSMVFLSHKLYILVSKLDFYALKLCGKFHV